jgi:hypothetical protein
MSFDIQARTFGVELSRKARLLLSPRAMNDLVRGGLIHGGEEWIVGPLRRRFERGYASLLGYMTSQRRGRMGTYDEKKRTLQGHTDPLVWTGRLRAMVFAQARAEATATGGVARGRITFGRLSVGRPGSYVAPPRIVVQTLLGGPSRRLPAAEVAIVRDGFRDYITKALDGLTTPQKTALPAPAQILDRRRQRLAQRRMDISTSQRARQAIASDTRTRRQRTRRQHRLRRRLFAAT